MLKFVLIIILIWIFIKIVKVNAINKYFYSILYLVIGNIPICVGLLLFDHSMLSQSDIAITSGMWFWVVICLLYTSAFIFLYLINIPLIHPIIWKKFNINFIPSDDDWKPAILQMVLYSIFAGFITWFKHGNFIHFVENSLLLAILMNIILFIFFIILEKWKKYFESYL